MNREVHVRIWERPEVRALRATRQGQRCDDVDGMAARHSIAEETGRLWHLGFVPRAVFAVRTPALSTAA